MKKFCLDIGHAVLVREQPENFMRVLGNKCLTCLHIHDVDGINDSHTLPYFGIAYWKRIMEALAEIYYKGDFTYEACCFIEKIPDDLIGDYLKGMERTGRYLINIFDNAKKLTI